MVITLPFFLFKRGRTIVFQHPVYGMMIKKIERVESGDIYVVGTHPNSLDSRQFGPIRGDDVVGLAIWHIRKPGE